MGRSYSFHPGRTRDQPDGQINPVLLNFPVQSPLRKYFASRVGQIISTTRAVLSYRGALRNVINAGGDAVDAGGVGDENAVSRGR